MDGVGGERGRAHGLMRGKKKRGAGIAGSLGVVVLYCAGQRASPNSNYKIAIKMPREHSNSHRSLPVARVTRNAVTLS